MIKDQLTNGYTRLKLHTGGTMSMKKIRVVKQT